MWKPSDIFGQPRDVLGEVIEGDETWIEWITRPRRRPISHEWRNNVKAGITVALINVPLSISLAIASGGDPAAGCVSAVWAALGSGLFSSSHFNVVGPTGALSGMLAVTAHRYGPNVLPLVSILTSMWLLLFSVLHIDQYMRFVSTGVEHGFSIGVALIIAASQIPSAFGLTGLASKEKLLDKIQEDARHIGTMNRYDTTMFLCTFVPLWYLIGLGGKIPWQIIFVGIGIIVGMTSPTGMFTLLKDKYPTLELSLFSPIDLSQHKDIFLNTDLLMYSFGVALVALLETLISSRIANNIVKDKEFLNYSSRRDSFGLSLTNFFVGIFGGIPATAALARTSLNIRSGAYSRVAGFVSCVTVAILCSILLPYFKFIPMAMIAGILMMVAYRLIDFHELKEINLIDTANMYSLFVTAAACVLTDTFVGLIIGMVVSVALHYRYFTEDCVEFELHSDESGPIQDANHKLRCVTAHVKAAFVFNNSDSIKEKVSDEPLHLVNHKEIVGELSTPVEHRHLKLIIDLSAVERMDFDGAKILGELISLYRLRGWLVDVVNHEHLRHSLSRCVPFHELLKLEYEEI